MRAIDDIRTWKLFDLVKSLGSIQLAAKAYGVDSSEVSRKITALETELKLPLFNRQERPFKLTAEAEEISETIELMLDCQKKIEDFAGQKNSGEQAIIRFMLPDTFRFVVHSILFNYLEYFPKQRIQVISPVNTPDFRLGRADIAAMTGNVELPEAMLVPRGRMIFVPVASKNFLKKYGPLEHPSQLSEVPIGLTFGGDTNSHTPLRYFVKSGQRFPVILPRKIEWQSNNLILEALLAGECASVGLPLFFCIEHLKKGQLVPILNGWHRPSQFNYLACHKTRWNISYIRTFMNWFAERFAEKEALFEKEFEALFGAELLHELMSS